MICKKSFTVFLSALFFFFITSVSAVSIVSATYHNVAVSNFEDIENTNSNQNNLDKNLIVSLNNNSDRDLGNNSDYENKSSSNSSSLLNKTLNVNSTTNSIYILNTGFVTVSIGNNLIFRKNYSAPCSISTNINYFLNNKISYFYGNIIFLDLFDNSVSNFF